MTEKNNKNILYCSFCGKSQHEVRKLIAGPTVFICDECVELCMDIIKEENKWLKIELKDGKQGWISKRALKEPKAKKDPFAKLARSKGVGSVSKTDVVAATKGLFDLNIQKADPKAKKVLKAQEQI